MLHIEIIKLFNERSDFGFSNIGIRKLIFTEELSESNNTKLFLYLSFPFTSLYTGIVKFKLNF